MKITLDKKTITLDQVEAAKEFARAEAEWIDKDVIKSCAAKVLGKYYEETENDNCYISIEDLISTGTLEVTYDRFELCVYASDVIVRYWHDGHKFAMLGINIQDVCADNVHSYIRIYGEQDDRII